jgi:NAD(P)H-flavin reductase
MLRFKARLGEFVTLHAGRRGRRPYNASKWQPDKSEFNTVDRHNKGIKWKKWIAILRIVLYNIRDLL